MSEAVDDAALEAQAEAAIAAEQEAESGVKEAAGDKPPEQAATKSPIQATAEKIGWAGKDEWKGDPADWIDAPDFILKAAGEVLPSMRKSLEDARSEISGLKKAVNASIQHISKARQEGYEQRSRELQAELAQYAQAGDVENVKAVTKDIVDLEKEVREAPKAIDEAPEEPPEFTAWKFDNPWFGKDKALTAAAAALGEEVAIEGYTGRAQIKEVDRRLREQFPEKFKPAVNPNRSLPGAVEGAGTARRQGSKGFSDMPREAQEMCLELVKLSNGKITKEGYVREHFAEENNR